MSNIRVRGLSALSRAILDSVSAIYVTRTERFNVACCAAKASTSTFAVELGIANLHGSDRALTKHEHMQSKRVRSSYKKE